MEASLPAVLAEGKLIVAPELQVVGKGLGYVQEPFDVHKDCVFRVGNGHLPTACSTFSIDRMFRNSALGIAGLMRLNSTPSRD